MDKFEDMVGSLAEAMEECGGRRPFSDEIVKAWLEANREDLGRCFVTRMLTVGGPECRFIVEELSCGHQVVDAGRYCTVCGMAICSEDGTHRMEPRFVSRFSAGE